MKHFLDLADWTAADLQYLLDSAVTLKEEHRRGGQIQLEAVIGAEMTQAQASNVHRSAIVT